MLNPLVNSWSVTIKYVQTKIFTCLCGDFNARIATKDDSITDSPKYLPSCKSYRSDNEETSSWCCRRSYCIENQGRIMKDRWIGDIFGSYAWFNTLGQSTVDYLLSSENGIEFCFLYFKVTEFIAMLSDCHCKSLLHIKIYSIITL